MLRLQHGSGKTAVLVERIIQKIIKDKIDVDKILVVTFTNAAASEMRERILEAIYKKLNETPKDLHLQKQVVLLNKSNISTIHAFCLEVIKNNFYEIDLSPNFRIGDTAEMELLKQDVLDEIFEELYEEENKEFIKLIDTYAGYRDDINLKELVLKVYKFIQSNPFPEEWLEEKVNLLKQDESTDFAKTRWGHILLNDLKQTIQDGILELEYINKELVEKPEFSNFTATIAEDIFQYEDLIKSMDNWDNLYEKAVLLKLSKWPTDKKVDENLKEKAKEVRDRVKKKITDKRDKILIYNQKEAKEAIMYMYPVLNSLKNLVIKFTRCFEQAKKEENCIDFNDIEHYALKILVKKENGEYVSTEVAKKYQDKFEEIAIDEYQDSNLVQEYILSTISRKNNIFMVGDVKQSIYKFRQARPELFLEKYEKYKLIEDKKENEDIKILLFQNFRSRSNILDLTNLVFDTIMSKKLGDIEYNEKEYLRQLKDYDMPKDDIKNFDGKAELNIINLAEETEEDDDEEERIENAEIEAKLVMQKINNLLKSEYHVFDKKKKVYRKATYKDIVILLRATANSAPIYEKVLSDAGMPVFSDTSSEYLSAIEIQTILCVLKILDNPLQDIPLASVLRSYIGDFSDNELIKIRLFNSNSYFYEALKTGRIEAKGKLKEKIEKFCSLLEKWDKEKEYLTLEELIWKIYMDTGYYHYVSLMPDGNLRIANLKMLLERAKQYEEASFKGLFNFIHFIEKLSNNSGDLGSAKLIGENENVIRIMSIHKSKGLEFPIVFVCGLGKKFNMHDLSDKLLLHHEIGLGPTCINTEKGIEYTTLAKEAIKLKARDEAISEEMRVLYVALTRAREKLILTGIDKNYEKSVAKKDELVKVLGGVNEGLLKQYISYLDWIELVHTARKKEIEDLLDITIYSKNKILKENIAETEEKTRDIKELEGRADNKEIEKLLSWEYGFKDATKIPSKTTVTQIKKEKTKTVVETSNLSYKEEIPLPLFLKETDEITGAEKGSAMHIVLQKIDFKKEYSKQDIEELLERLVFEKTLTKKQAESVSVLKIDTFLKSDLAKEIKEAKAVYKEAPFYLSLTSKEAFEIETDEKVLVQGIIDLYFEKENGEIVLVDYKTDYAKSSGELIEKYKVQLDLYKKALEAVTHKKVSKTYIYSIYFEKEIEI